MGDRPPKQVDPYFFDPMFERIVVTMACTNSRFWGRVAHAVDPDCLGLEPSKLALKAARQIALELHHGPESVVLVLQRLRRWMEDGKVALDKIKEVAGLFDDAFEHGLLSEDAAVAELAPVLKKRIKADAMREAIEDYGRDSNFGATTRLIDKANRLGDTNTSVGVRLGSGSYEEIEKIQHLETLPTGIWELDNALDGGLRRGCLGILLGGSGDGKSMGLSHIGAWSIQGGLFVGYATLEVTPPDVLARVKANICDVPINVILQKPRIVEPVLSKMPLGPFIVQEFTPQATTMQDIEEWVKKCEDEVGRQMDVLITDYGDKLVAPKNAGKDGEHGYSMGRIVFERMRIYANEGHPGGKIWHWTAAQGTRQQKAKSKGVSSRLDLNDIADSMHKARVADLVVSLNPSDDGITWHVAKNRHGHSKMSIGPLPSDFAIGRVAPVMIRGARDPNEFRDADDSGRRLGGGAP